MWRVCVDDSEDTGNGNAVAVLARPPFDAYMVFSQASEKKQHRYRDFIFQWKVESSNERDRHDDQDNI